LTSISVPFSGLPQILSSPPDQSERFRAVYLFVRDPDAVVSDPQDQGVVFLLQAYIDAGGLGVTGNIGPGLPGRSGTGSWK
jgi:hypothetical protein